MKKIGLILFLVISLGTSALAESEFYKSASRYNRFQPDRSAYSSCDPFVAKFDGYYYYMVVDDGTPYTHHSILGCKWPKEALFNPLRELDKDRDKKISKDELVSANIRFVKLDIGRRLEVNNKNKDYDIDNIVYIDLKSLRVGAASVPMGSFDIYTCPNRKPYKKIIGKTFSLHPHSAKRMIEY